MSSAEHRITFAGHSMVLNGHGVLYWPDQGLLVASDLHLEKGTFLAQRGSTLPPYDTLDTLERLERSIADYEPRRLLLLGDSFHDCEAWERLDEGLRVRLTRVAGRANECIWVEGNHDVGLRIAPFAFVDAAEFEGVLFSHHYNPDYAGAQMIGHYHPCTTIFLSGRRLRGKCFLQAEQLMIMPAFGTYTGGLDVQDAAYALLPTDPRQLHLIYQGSIYPLHSGNIL